MPGTRVTPIEAARSMLAVPLDDLWVDYFALGGSLAPGELRAFFDGRRSVDDRDYDRLVQALNERFTDRGEDHPLDYADELPSEPR